ncbi:MAG: PKD domain-containing protein, partial [Flavisolibacter sp.]
RFPVGPNGGAIDILSPLLQPGTNDPIDAFQAGDGIHINNAGHRVVYEVMKSANIFRNLIPSASNIVNPTNSITQVNNLEQGVHYFQIGVRDNYGNAADTIVMVTQHPQTGCAGQRRVLAPFNGGISLVGGSFDYNPGDTIILSTQYNNWSYLSLTNIHGTPSCPIIVMNSGGQIRMRDGISLQNCSYIKILGTGSNDFYGFHIESTNQEGTAVSISGKSRVIEISNVSIRNKAYGSWCKNEASCDPTINDWTLDSISVHDWKIRNTASQGFYWGSTSPSGLRPVICNGVTIYPKPSRLDNLKIYNMDIDSTGRAGIQVSAGQDRNNPGVSEIYNNVIRNTGRQLDESQGGAISLGGYTRAYVHNNDIKYGFIWGIWGVGASLCRIENNRVDSIGWHKGVNTELMGYATPIMVQSSELDPQDSVQYIVRNNHVGVGGSSSPGRVWIAGAYLRRTPGLNFVCGNKNLNETPALVSIAAGAVYSGNCSGGNVTPIANAGADQTITLPVNTVTVNGVGSDADGTIASYLWTKISGPVTFNIVSPTQAQTVINNLVQGIYRFELKLTDNLGALDRDTLTITVNSTAPPANQSPVANAGPDRTITLPTNTVTLTGSGTDPDGNIAGYFWTRISGPTTFSIGTSTQAQTVVNNLVQGIYRFELRVTDNQGAIDRDTVMVTVNAAPPPPNQAPIAYAGSNISIILPVNTVNLSGTGTDSDGNITGYQWNKISGPTTFVIVNATQAQTAVNNLVQGVYSFELRVNDNQGAAGRDTITVTVNAEGTPPPPPNQAPTANAGADHNITLPVNMVTVNGSGNDADGTIASYIWTRISGPASFNIVNPSQAQTVINNLVQGVYRFELRVTDNQGAIDRDTVNVTVNAAAPLPNQAPVAYAGADHNITLPASSVNLNGSGTDADGTIAAYQWTRISGPAGYTIVSSAQAQTIVNSLVQGVYRFELRVTDNQGAMGRDTVTVTVNAAVTPPPPPPPPANQPPVANAGSDIDITLPVNNITLPGSASDADGSIVGYQWRRITGPIIYSISTPNQAQTDVTDLVEGIYKFELTVLDNDGAVAKDTVMVTVNALPPSKATLYPNPATDHINIRIEANTHVNNSELRIYDVSGRVVYYENFVRNTNIMTKTINVSALPSGSYYVEVEVDINNKVVCKFVK